MTHDVFISYAAGDKQIADSICSYLEKNKIICWIAPRDIAPGEIYASALIHAIDSVRIVVIVFSHHSDSSAHVRTEIQRAFNQGKFIIPFRVEKVKPSDELQYFISGRQWLDAFPPPLDTHLSRLLNVIKTQLSVTSGTKSITPSQTTGTLSKPADLPTSAPLGVDGLRKVLEKFAEYPADMISRLGIRLSRNKKRFFVIVGFVSGALGSLLGESVLHSDFGIVLFTALTGMMISIGLFWATRVYNRRTPDLWDLLKKSVPSGFIAGAISGGIAAMIFGLASFIDDLLVKLFIQAACWGIFGCLLGWNLSRSNRNMGPRRALIAGAIGGFVGDWGFQFIALVIPETLGRMFGFGIIGAALGLTLILVEERYRSAFLEVHWAPNESSEFTLGNIPVFIGGGREDDVYVNGIPPHAMSLWMEKGTVKGTYHVTGDNKELQDGSPIKLGKVEMIVRIKST